MSGYGSETASSILGWMSIACWVVVYSPQIIENYQLKSGEGLSLLFVYIWLAGDLCNLGGALLAGLLPTIIILAAYYTVCDIILLGQIYYYRWLNSTRPPIIAPALTSEHPAIDNAQSEQTPLIARDTRDNTSESNEKDERSFYKPLVQYGGALLFVLATGVVAWAIDERIHRDQNRTQPEEVFEWKSQVLGWASAIMYIGARIPQIVKNLATKCEGLSPALFLFSITGNVTYMLSILALSLDPKHLAANAGWMAGSGLTVFLDVFVLAQFFWYQVVEKRRSSSTGSQA